MNPFITDSVRLIDRHAIDAATLAAKAEKWFTELTSAKAAASTDEEEFTRTFSVEGARNLAEAQRKVAGLTAIVAAIENVGGPSEVKVRALNSAAVHSAFRQGFAERIVALNKLIPGARKRLGDRRALLTEQGLPLPLIEVDPEVRALRAYGDAITADLATATFGETYSATRGDGREPVKFNDRYAALAAPLPQAPATR